MIKIISKRKCIKLIVIVFIILVLCVLFKFQNEFLKVIYPKKFEEYVSKYALEYEVEENLIYAVIKAESNFDEDAISNKEAKGLMQLMNPTANEVAKKINIQITDENIQEPEYNIMLGTKYLSMMITKYGNIELALTAYNAGSGTVDKWISDGTLKEDGSNIENIPYKETNNYVRKILRDYKIYNEIWNARDG